MGILGWIHTIFGVVALLAGTAVVLLKKGTRLHRTLGHVYFNGMLALNITALFIYNLFGGFGPFHWLALFSLITLIAGMIPVLFRWPDKRWVEFHAGFISGSYVGLVAAFAAEITSRLPGTENSFGLVVGVTSAVINGVGFALIIRYLTQNRLAQEFKS